MAPYDEEIKKDVTLHLQEADDIKNQWFSYVYRSIERLSAKVEATALKVEHERVEVLERLNKLRDMLSRDIKAGNAEQIKQLEKVEERVERLVAAMSVKLDGVSIADIRLQLDVYVQESEDKMTKSLKDFADKTNAKVQELNDTQIVLKTKIKSYAVVASLIITAVATVASSFVGQTIAQIFTSIPK